MGRPRKFDREAAIDVAVDVFWRKGYAATSVAELCKAMNIFSPSFYAAFTSKAALYLEVVARYNAARGPMIWDDLEKAPTARQGIGAVLANTATSYTDPAYPPGCLVILSTAESDGNERLAEFVSTNRAEIFTLFRRRLARAVETGELSPQLNIDALARVFATLAHGVAMQARDGVPRIALAGMVQAVMLAWPALTTPQAQTDNSDRLID